MVRTPARFAGKVPGVLGICVVGRACAPGPRASHRIVRQRRPAVAALGPVQLQPSELAKWAAVLFLAWWLTRPSLDSTVSSAASCPRSSRSASSAC